MRIVYIAKFDSGGNEDENAILHALRQLGHEVITFQEPVGPGRTATNRQIEQTRLGLLSEINRLKDIDLILFHKWCGWAFLPKWNQCPKVFWYFDLVDYPDPTLRGRCLTRLHWMAQTIPMVDIGFCTDGDWVNQDKSGKLVRLTQGADELVTGIGTQVETPKHRLLFTGIKKLGGTGRIDFVNQMSDTYGSDFHHIQGVYKRDLANLIADSAIVLAPDHPVTDHYWSNRVYNTLGFGGFLIHPYCQTLTEQYTPGQEIVMYSSIEELHSHIRYYSDHPEERQRISQNGLIRTINNHTYRHRCQTLINTVKEKFNLD